MAAAGCGPSAAGMKIGSATGMKIGSASAATCSSGVRSSVACSSPRTRPLSYRREARPTRAEHAPAQGR
eukprot:1956291-Prymnesium_polylepis.1